MRTNTPKPSAPAARTHGGALTNRAPTVVEQLRRSVMSCFLWEDNFYEDGVSHATRMAEIVSRTPVQDVVAIAIEARTVHNLRHVPLQLAALIAPRAEGTTMRSLLSQIVKRPDEIAEFISLFWKAQGGRKMLPRQIKLGLADALRTFDRYQIAKWRGTNNAVSLRDAIRLIHPKAHTPEQYALWGEVVAGTLRTEGTWEAMLSAGNDKAASFEALLTSGKMPYLALLRNLRNMSEAGVSRPLIRKALLDGKGADKVLPFRYVAAGRAAPSYRNLLSDAMVANLKHMPKLTGRTVYVIDVSGSMYGGNAVSKHSELSRIDAAAALGAIGREISEDAAVYVTGGNDYARKHATKLITTETRGLALADDIANTYSEMGGGGIFMAQLMRWLCNKESANAVDRVIVITDEQDCDVSAKKVPTIPGAKHYLINVSTYQNGVAYNKDWTHINGFSEGVFKWIAAVESNNQDALQR